MKKSFSAFFAACLALLTVYGIANAVAPSGPGQTTAAHSVSVVFASDATLPSVSVTGGATAAKQDTGNTSLASIDTKLSSQATAANQTTLNGYVDGLEALVTSTNTKLDTLHTDVGTTLHADVDGLETLITATNAALELLKQPTRTAAVTVSDSTDVTSTCTKGIWVGVSGDVAVKGAGDSSASTLKNVSPGSYIPGAFSRVMSTNTTASSIVCFYGP